MSKTVQKSGAQPAVRQDSHAVYPTHYSVKIHSLRPEGSCRATASVNINGCFAVRGIKVMDSSKGLFVSMPSYRAGNGEYKDICFPCTKEARAEFDSAVLDAYHLHFELWRNAMKKLNKKAILTITGIALPLGAAAILIPRLRKRRRCKRTSA